MKKSFILFITFFIFLLTIFSFQTTIAETDIEEVISEDIELESTV